VSAAGEMGPRLRATRAAARSALALPLSIGAHVVVLYAVSQAAWDEVEAPRRAPLRVALLTAPRTSAPEPPRADSEPAVAEPAVAEPSADAAPATDAPPTPPREQTAEPEESPAAQASAAPAEPAAPERPPRPRVDWESARRDAIAATLETREREARFPTFSVRDHIVTEEPEKPSPRAEIFSSPTPSRSFAQPGQQRTKIGRAFVKACNAFTGGFGVNLFGFTFGGISFCAQADGNGGLFADIEPDYLKYPAECFDAGATPEDGLPAGPLRDPATAKCRIGPREP
jgi:hypothetical protein